MKHEYNYSTYPMKDYFIYNLGGHCEVGTMSRMPRGQSIWNLFWLSLPTLDTLPGAGPRWVQGYRALPSVGASIVSDVTLDEVLYRKLLMHPTSFVAWFEREDHTIYDVYNLLGEQQWVETVLQRARESAKRMAMSVPILRKEGNVTYAIFGKKAA